MNHSKIVLTLVLWLCGLPGCGSSDTTSRPFCPAVQTAPVPLPGVLPSQRTASYWIARAPDVDNAWLDQAAIRLLNRTLADPARALPIYELITLDTVALERVLHRRLKYLNHMLRQGHYRSVGQSSVTIELLASDWQSYLAPKLHIAKAPVPIYCGPSQAQLVAVDDPLQLDRNRCSTVQAGEDIQVLATWPNGMRLARTYYAFGWISGDAPLSGPRSELSQPFADGPTLPLTRRRWLHQAFALLDHPYGWGGEKNGLDCSSFVMQVFRPFGLKLPRHSRQQMRALPRTIDVATGAGDAERLSLIDSAQRQGVVLLHFPGHIMIYLGRDHRGTPMVIHAFAQYLKPCSSADQRETRMLVNRVDISPLSLGEHTSTGSLLSRIDLVGTLSTP